MKKIKTKEIGNKTVKSLDKTIAWTERVKDPVVYLNDKVKDQSEGNSSITEYEEDKIKYVSNRAKDESIYATKKAGNKATEKIKNEFKKKRLKNKPDKVTKETIKGSKKTIKNTKDTIKKTEKIAKESAKASKRMLEQGRKLAIKSAKAAARTTKAAIKLLISTVKAIIAALKSLIGAIIAGGWVAVIVIIVICLVALLLGSIFGIFFANEGESRTMTSVISEVNQEVYRKMETEQFLHKADDVVIDSSYSNWKEIIAVYSVKYSSENTEGTIVMYLNDDNVGKLKRVFYDFNTITTELKREQVEEEYEDYLEGTKTRKVFKNILHIKVTSKSLEQVMSSYRFDDDKKEQVNELLNSQYDDLWTSLIYGSGSGDYVYWRQKGAPWSNIQIGSSGKSIGNIGCLVTSIAILIEKSGVETGNIVPFNPGTFVEALNKNGGFDRDGNLQYSPINTVVPKFEYVGRVELTGKNQTQKLKLINEYQSKGYYLAVEVKGDTGQHWVAVMSINGSNINIVDPGSDATVMWNAYSWSNTSQFVYFRVKE